MVKKVGIHLNACLGRPKSGGTPKPTQSLLHQVRDWLFRALAKWATTMIFTSIESRLSKMGVDMKVGNLPNQAQIKPLNSVEPPRRTDNSAVSVIGADILITGNIDASIELHIEGKVVGDVRCATLILGAGSVIEGRIYATRVKVSGSVEGAIETKDLAIESEANVNGEITYERLRIANGATVSGQLTHTMADSGPADTSKLKLVPPDPGKDEGVKEA